MISPPLLFKLFLFGLLWSQSYRFTNIISKVISNNDISTTLSFTLVFILIHIIDIYYEQNEIN